MRKIIFTPIIVIATLYMSSAQNEKKKEMNRKETKKEIKSDSTHTKADSTRKGVVNDTTKAKIKPHN